MGRAVTGPTPDRGRLLRQQPLRNVFHVRASYSDETVRVVQQLVSVGLKDIAIDINAPVSRVWSLILPAVVANREAGVADSNSLRSCSLCVDG